MIKEIGFWRIIRYLIYGLWDLVFGLLPWSPLRILWMNLGGARVSWSAVIDKIVLMNLDRTGLFGLKIETRAYVGPGTVIDLAGRISINRDATIAPGAVILSHFSVGFHSHPLLGQYPKKVEQTIIGRGVFLGANATVLSGIVIGERAMVAAGSVVTGNVPESTLVAGVPAVEKRKIK